MINIKPWPVARVFDGALKPIAKMSQTRANSRAALIADFIVSVVLLTMGIRSAYQHPFAALFTCLSGLILFTLIEYCFHRWLFHGSIPLMEPGHRKHHESPLGYDSLPFFLPPVLVLMLLALFTLFMPMSYALLLAGGLAAGYSTYGLSHLAIHVTRFRHPLIKRWAAIHYIHHHHPDKNFGVTTPLWDIVLGTRYVPTRHRD
jgi:sterol desaturase/sphingolipid hydroxylase (fatty acid hydroxylase superfamily)